MGHYADQYDAMYEERRKEEARQRARRLDLLLTAMREQGDGSRSSDETDQLVARKLAEIREILDIRVRLDFLSGEIERLQKISG